MEQSKIFKALLEVQKELKPIEKKSENPYFHSKYADIVDVATYLYPILHRHGLGVTQLPSRFNEVPTLKTVLFHADSGELIESEMPLILPKNDPQAQGSAITYARRYALMGLTGLVAKDEDDDGNKAASHPKTPPRASQTETGELASPKQKNYILQLTKGFSVPDTLLVDFVGKISGLEDTSNMTSKQASKTIEALKELSQDAANMLIEELDGGHEDPADVPFN